MMRYVRLPLMFLLVGLAGIVVVTALFSGGYYYVAPSLPDAQQLRDVKLQTPLRVYSRDGRLIAQFGEQLRTPVPYREIPSVVVQAVLAAEDDRFFEHPGFDYQGIIRAGLNVLRTGGGRGQGGSTITQQVARMYFLSRERTYVRKFKEWILAVRIEREFSKEEILELYLNTTFFGQQSYGVHAAAQTYFGKPLVALTLSEAAIIAGIPQGPSVLNPVASPEAAAGRRSYVLRRMRELGLIEETDYLQALAEPIVARRYRPQSSLEAPYVAEMVRAEMIRRFGPAAYTAGLKVKTTLDSRLQRAANSAVRSVLIDYDERHGYRGPLARLGAEALQVPQSRAPEEHWRQLLADYERIAGFSLGLVTEVLESDAEIYFDAEKRTRVAVDAVAWAAPYVSDNRTGNPPRQVGDVLQVGDVVRFRRLADGRWRLAQIPEVQGAIAAVDPQDGAVAALVGGFDFFLSNYNRATQSTRQPGSSFKPFVYSAALENGFTAATIVNDAPLVLESEELEDVWRPQNYSGRFSGPTRLREALVRSLNLVSVRVILELGPAATVQHLRRFGFSDVALPMNATLALGAGGVAPVELAAGFAVFANGGQRVPPYFVESVEDSAGEVLYRAAPALACVDCTPVESALASPALVRDVTELYPRAPEAPRAISRQNAYLITDMMQDVIRRGTARRALQLGRNDLAGKTGTSNDRRDTWFAGFNADLVATVWVGFDQDRPLGDGEEGARTALPVWNAFMADALAGQSDHLLARPPGIIEVRINPETGRRAAGMSGNQIFEKFKLDHLPEWESEPLTKDVGPAPLPGTEPRTDESVQPIF
jgi:penicillin-binding protein 1A